MKYLVGTKNKIDFQKMLNQWNTAGYTVEFKHISFENDNVNFVLIRWEPEEKYKQYPQWKAAETVTDDQLPF